MGKCCGPRSRGHTASLLAALVVLSVVLVALIPSSAQALDRLGAPRNLRATPGDAQVSLTWEEPKAAGQYKIDYYIVYQEGVDVQHSAGTSTVIAGLTNGRTYSFAVAAHSSAGIGERSSVVRSTPLRASTVPGAPTDLRATAGDAAVSLSWTAPASDGGEAIDYYVIYRDGADVIHVNTNSATVSGLTNDRAYEFAVAAHNAAGTGRASAALTATPSAPLPSVPLPTTTPPTPSEAWGPPTDLRATPGDGAVTLTWSAPSGAVIEHYVVYQDGVDVMHVTGTSATVTGLVNGEVHSYAVVAHGPGGDGPASATIAASSTGAVEEGDNTVLMVGVLILTGAAGAVALMLMSRTRARRPD